MNNLQVFNYNGNEVRTIQKDGEPWWVLKDVCEVLGLSSPHKVFDWTRTKRGGIRFPPLGESRK